MFAKVFSQKARFNDNLNELISRKYSGLTDIRFLLALGVIFAHCGPLLNGNGAPNLGIGCLDMGQMSVRGFMFISGLLVSISARKHSFRAYLLRRIARIYPGFLFCLISTIFIILPIFGLFNGIDLASTWIEPQGSPDFLLNNLFIAIRQYQVLPYTDLFAYKGAINGSL